MRFTHTTAFWLPHTCSTFYTRTHLRCCRLRCPVTFVTYDLHLPLVVYAFATRLRCTLHLHIRLHCLLHVGSYMDACLPSCCLVGLIPRSWVPLLPRYCIYTRTRYTHTHIRSRTFAHALRTHARCVGPFGCLHTLHFGFCCVLRTHAAFYGCCSLRVTLCVVLHTRCRGWLRSRTYI